MGASVQVSTPASQYDPSKAINLGTNRWSIKPEDIGFSKSLGAVTLDFTTAGAILALPMDRYNSVKFTFSNGISTRTGTDFTIYGIAWQYRWGAGY